MRIERSRLTYRKRRRTGCVSPVLLLGMLIGGLITFSWNLIGQWWDSGALVETEITNISAAQAAFNTGNLDRAITIAEQWLAAKPNDVEAVVLLARALIYRSYSDYNREFDRQTALTLTTRAVANATNPVPADLNAVHAFVLQATGQPGAAVDIANRVLDSNPDHALARMAMAMAYSSVGSHDIALRESQQATENPGWRMDTHRAAAIGYSGVGDYQNALKSVERAILLNDKLIPLYFEQALYARQQGNTDAATVAYFQILALDPDNVKARFRLCELSSVLRERDAAINYCQQVTELAPDWADGWYQLGREYFLQGNFALAKQNLNQCSTLQIEQRIPIGERRFECWYLQGQAAEILGDCPALISTYNEYRAMSSDSDFRQTWIYPPEGPPSCLTPTAPPT